MIGLGRGLMNLRVGLPDHQSLLKTPQSWLGVLQASVASWQRAGGSQERFLALAMSMESVMSVLDLVTTE